jgi:hypothetical protein
MKRAEGGIVIRHFSYISVSVIVWAACAPLVGENKPIDVTGKWQLSWEARIGTEQGTLQLRQTGRKLTGTFQGRHGSIGIFGGCEGKNISFDLSFPGSHPYTLSFKGSMDGDKMAGTFEVQGVEGGYDWHGENVRPTNYSWTGVRQPSGSADTGPALPDRKQKASATVVPK